MNKTNDGGIHKFDNSVGYDMAVKFKADNGVLIINTWNNEKANSVAITSDDIAILKKYLNDNFPNL